VVLRDDDVEDKLVVAPASSRLSAAEIERILHFQEQFFASRIVSWRAWHDD
jgi:hypothetical protein